MLMVANGSIQHVTRILLALRQRGGVARVATVAIAHGAVEVIAPVLAADSVKRMFGVGEQMLMRMNHC